MADRMIVMNGGIAEQIGTPLEVYERPQTLFAAQFIGSPSMNILDAAVVDGRVRAAGLVFDCPGPVTGAKSLGLRPEHLVPDAGGPITMQVLLAEPLGANTLLHGRIEGSETPFTASLAGVHRLKQRNETLRLQIDPANLHLFDNTGQRIS